MILSAPERIQEYTARGWWGTRRIHDWLDDNAAERPSGVSLVDPPNRADYMDGAARRLTWSTVQEEAQKVAALLLSLGLRKDDIVCIQLPNVVELPVVYLGCMMIGVVFSPVPVQYREHELNHILGVTRPKAIITAERIGKFRNGAMMDELAGEHRSVRCVLRIDRHELKPADSRLLQEGIAADRPDANDVVSICWTSGTESFPKGVPRSHNEWMVFPETSQVSAKLDRGCHLLNAFPLVNMAGIAGQFLPWLMLGAKLVLHHPFDLKVFLDQIRDEKINYTVSSPAILATLAQNPLLMEGLAGAPLKAIGSAGGPLPEWVVRKFSEDYGIDVVNYFGSNEGCTLTSNAIDVPDFELRARYFPRFGVAGFNWNLPIARKMETRLVDPETEEIIEAPGRPGELRAKGAPIFGGYFAAPEATARAFDRDGFYRSGDLFEIAGPNSQFYKFVGRHKDIIVRGGFNISCEELEAIISSHDAVLEAAAVGYPDDKLGERVCAFVVLKQGRHLDLGELNDFIRSEHRIAVYKLPERLEIVLALPRNPVGKILRRELRQRVAAAR